MVKATVVSIFRDSATYLDRYFSQVTRQLENTPIALSLVEGDSVDGTYRLLVKKAATLGLEHVKVTKLDSHKQRYGSVVHPERFRILADTFNAGLDAIEWDTEWVVYLDSDLIVPELTIERLINRADGYAIAPYIFAGEAFYDIWGFRKNGAHFGPFPPYVAGAKTATKFEIDSAGAMLVIPGQYIKAGARLAREDCVVGLCRNLRVLGCKIYADPTIKINHPC